MTQHLDLRTKEIKEKKIIVLSLAQKVETHRAWKNAYPLPTMETEIKEMNSLFNPTDFSLDIENFHHFIYIKFSQFGAAFSILKRKISSQKTLSHIRSQTLLK